jgi:hypothetical protein
LNLDRSIATVDFTKMTRFLSAYSNPYLVDRNNNLPLTLNTTLASQRYLLTCLLLAIACSAGFATFNVPQTLVPRVVFVAMMGLTCLLTLMLVFGLVYAPLRDRAYPQLLPNAIVIALFAISIIKLGITSFSTDDEIYSWNLWAIQHFHGQPASFYFTGSPYPQLFPYWIAALYQAFGTITIQVVPRLILALSTLLLGMAVIGLAKIASWRNAAIVSLILIITFGPVSIRLAKGLADPLMSAAMIVSVMLLIAYAREPQKFILLWLAVICAIIASLTKQAALIWACFSLPLTVGIGCWRYKWPKSALIPALAGLCLSAIWPLLIAPTFVHNNGVISASMASRSYLQQFAYAAHRYLIDRPEISLLFVICIFAVRRHAILRLLLATAFLPMLLAWFLFGAYEIRLGIHVLALAGLLSVCALTTSASVAGAARDRIFTPAPTRRIFMMVIAAFITAGVGLALWFGVSRLAEKNGVDLSDGGKATLRVQYGPNSKAFFDSLLHDKSRVWASNSYAFGPFFGRVPVAMPNLPEASIDGVKKDLLTFSADYAIATEQPNVPASVLLTALAQKCPGALAPILQPPNQYGFTLYKINRLSLSKECK